MSTITTPTTIQATRSHNSTPSFLGLVRGEFFKISRQWTVWLMLVLLLGIIALLYLITFTIPNIKDTLDTAPLTFFQQRMESNISVLRVFIGIFLLVLTSTVIGLEYQLGTIRILLARGVRRLQLLAAKVLTVALFGLIVFAVSLLLNVLFMSLIVFLIAGNLNAFHALNATFWNDTRVYLWTTLLSMGVTILLATALSVLGRSLAIGLSAALIWFPVDNVGTEFLYLASRLTKSNFWLNISAYLLGPNLNTMPASILNKRVLDIGITPLVQVDGPHTLYVTLAYALLFIVVAILFMWKRDVRE
jgi:ABC-type transport system involved in multi-copper enzyme maturation permease subunit